MAPRAMVLGHGGIGTEGKRHLDINRCDPTIKQNHGNLEVGCNRATIDVPSALGRGDVTTE